MNRNSNSSDAGEVELMPVLLHGYPAIEAEGGWLARLPIESHVSFKRRTPIPGVVANNNMMHPMCNIAEEANYSPGSKRYVVLRARLLK
jgi:hypothetical protein